ncbi:MAG: hypothetical protein JXA42_08180, partial [Anaerolineales bacterium]|nr:hypothetical protein [Anaerolineales bacterium]
MNTKHNIKIVPMLIFSRFTLLFFVITSALLILLFVMATLTHASEYTYFAAGANILSDEKQTPESVADSPQYANGLTIPVTYNVLDSGAGLDLLRMYYKFDAGWLSTNFTSTSTSGTFYFTPTNGEGAYYFQSIITDTSNNRESGPADSGDTTTIYDITPPTSTAASEAFVNSAPINVTYTVTETGGSGLYSVHLYYQYKTGGWHDSTLPTKSTCSD